MAKRLFTAQAQSWTAQATNTALTNATYMALQGGSSTQVVDILEVLVSGFASASTVAAFTLTPGGTPTTPTALATPNSDGPMQQNATALVSGSTVIPYVAAATGSTASNSATVSKVNLGMNAFGGIIRWNAAPTQQYTLIGNAATTGVAVLFNSSTGGGATASANAHIMYEPY
jgi:hypothetical protein